MRSIRALSITPSVQEWLAHARRPRILHIFPHACNLIDERGEVVSIVTPQVGDGPFNLVVETGVSFDESVDLQSPISLTPSSLSLGNLTLHTAQARLWNPRPAWEELHSRRRDIARCLNQFPIPDHQPPGSPSSKLPSAIVRADLLAVPALARQLAGLGPGLTPAGDDVLMGAMHAAWIVHPREVAGPLTWKIAAASAVRTTSLSAAWLKAAARGEAGVLWHNLCGALPSGAPAPLQSSIAKLLSVGHTSGADALSGFIGVFSYWFKAKGEQDVSLDSMAAGS